MLQHLLFLFKKKITSGGFFVLKNNRLGATIRVPKMRKLQFPLIQ